jgi:hypothetical protein
MDVPSSSTRWGSLLLVACLALAAATPARAVLIDFGDGTGNTTNPGFFGWDYVGEVNNLTGTYLGNGWVLTANHVGAGNFTLGGVTYLWIPGTEVQLDNESPTLADVLLFQVTPEPPLPLLPLRSTKPPIGEFAIVIGYGRDRGAPTSWDPNGPFPPPPEELDGWEWAQTRTKRWGTNEVEGFPVGLVNSTVALFTVFDEGQVLPESQAVNGDSGGAIFTINPTATELAGLIYHVGPALGQPPETSLYTNLTFAARIDFYYDQIQEVIAMPEPTGGFGCGLSLLALLGQRRSRRREAAGRGPGPGPDLQLERSRSS